MKQMHRVTLTGLKPGTTYHYRVNSHDAAANLASLADRKVLELYGPPGVVVNEDLDVVHIRGRTGAYLEPMPGAPSFNILRLARPDLHVELRRALHEAKTSGTRVTVHSSQR